MLIITHMDIQTLIRQEFNRVDALARSKYPAYAARPVPSIDFFTKGRCAGLAMGGYTWKVRFNTHILSQNLDMMRNTVSHEIAHMVDYALRGRSGHDAQWKALHRSLGGSGATTYNAAECGVKAIAGRRTNWYEYRHPVNGEVNWVGPKHHASLRRGKSSSLRNLTTGTQILREHFTGNSKVKG